MWRFDECCEVCLVISQVARIHPNMWIQIWVFYHCQINKNYRKGKAGN